ncbi:MAG: hypothetical protein R6X34_15725 [Chloroflexota bacterium]
MYANLRRNPHFPFHLKEFVHADLPVRAWFITDVDERQRILTKLKMGWYQHQVSLVEESVAGRLLVEACLIGGHQTTWQPRFSLARTICSATASASAQDTSWTNLSK